MARPRTTRRQPYRTRLRSPGGSTRGASGEPVFEIARTPLGLVSGVTNPADPPGESKLPHHSKEKRKQATEGPACYINEPGCDFQSVSPLQPVYWFLNVPESDYKQSDSHLKVRCWGMTDHLATSF